ncbi:hypothetical protein CRUP_024451 [Coryphaenoides rupestris]|nr:hypothetical protein CRUP_024451 [Coryphaenoides rupestris]
MVFGRTPKVPLLPARTALQLAGCGARWGESSGGCCLPGSFLREGCFSGWRWRVSPGEEEEEDAAAACGRWRRPRLGCCCCCCGGGGPAAEDDLLVVLDDDDDDAMLGRGGAGGGGGSATTTTAAAFSFSFFFFLFSRTRLLRRGHSLGPPENEVKLAAGEEPQG